MNQDRADILVKRIAEAFKGVPRPRITKSVARGLDDEWVLSDERFEELAARDPEVDWHEVTQDDVNTYNEYFCFADAEGWRFYLPAFMPHYLSNLESQSGEAVYWACTSPNPKFEMLSASQVACVKDFLELVHDA